jgi:hypothetical protein
MEITLHPRDTLERVEEGCQQRDDGVDQAPLATSATTAAKLARSTAASDA